MFSIYKGGLKMSRNDPVGVQRFKVEISGLHVAGFSEVSGLDMEIETEQIYEGGFNNRVHNLYKRVKYGRLKMLKGILLSSRMMEWFNSCQSGIVEKYDISVFLQNYAGENIREWRFIKAYPVKCSGPRLVANNANEIAVETYELVYEEQCSKGC